MIMVIYVHIGIKVLNYANRFNVNKILHNIKTSPIDNLGEFLYFYTYEND